MAQDPPYIVRDYPATLTFSAGDQAPGRTTFSWCGCHPLRVILRVAYSGAPGPEVVRTVSREFLGDLVRRGGAGTPEGRSVFADRLDCETYRFTFLSPQHELYLFADVAELDVVRFLATTEGALPADCRQERDAVADALDGWLACTLRPRLA